MADNGISGALWAWAASNGKYDCAEDGWAADEYQWKGDAFRFADKGMEDDDLVAQIQDDALRMGRELHVESCVLV